MLYVIFMRIQSSKQIGRLIASTRVAKGLSQKQLSEKAMVSPRWLILVEKGHNTPRLDLLLRTLTALDLGVQIQPLADNPLDDILSQ